MSTPPLPAPARSLADYTGPALIVPRLKGRTMQEVMQELSEALRQSLPTRPDLHAESRAALQRELLTGVDLTSGTVFPRVQVGGLPSPQFAVGRAADPVQWLATFYPPTEFVFLLAEPGVSTKESEQVVETISRLRRDQGILQELRSAVAAEALLGALGRFPLVSPEELAKARVRARR
jgi:mannitol/fructose-specific phosphotransferase system IIA component (Ntr-type)